MCAPTARRRLATRMACGTRPPTADRLLQIAPARAQHLPMHPLIFPLKSMKMLNRALPLCLHPANPHTLGTPVALKILMPKAHQAALRAHGSPFQLLLLCLQLIHRHPLINLPLHPHPLHLAPAAF